MIGAIALVVFATVTVGVYLALSRDLFRIVLGVAMVGSAANLVLFAAGRLGPTAPAVVPIGGSALVDAANPLPQALVLTAIVIGFALVCFSLVLMLRLIRDAGTDDALALRDAEPVPADPVKPPLPDPAFEPVSTEATDPNCPPDQELQEIDRRGSCTRLAREAVSQQPAKAAPR